MSKGIDLILSAVKSAGEAALRLHDENITLAAEVESLRKRVGTDVGDYDYPPGSAPCMCYFSTAIDSGPDPIGKCDYHAALHKRLAEADERHSRYVKAVGELSGMAARLAEAEALLSACYSPVRRIAEGGSRTREDLDLAAETFAALKRYLKPVAVPADSAPAVTGNCGLCGQPRADHAEVAPDGKPYCRMKSGNAGNIVKHAVSADVVQP